MDNLTVKNDQSNKLCSSSNKRSILKNIWKNKDKIKNKKVKKNYTEISVSSSSVTSRECPFWWVSQDVISWRIVRRLAIRCCNRRITDSKRQMTEEIKRLRNTIPNKTGVSSFEYLFGAECLLLLWPPSCYTCDKSGYKP